MFTYVQKKIVYPLRKTFDGSKFSAFEGFFGFRNKSFIREKRLSSLLKTTPLSRVPQGREVVSRTNEGYTYVLYIHIYLLHLFAKAL